MSKTEIIFKNVSEIIGTKDKGLLVLVDKNEEYLLSITCERYDMQLFDLYFAKGKVLERMLPTVLWSIISSGQSNSFELLILDVVDGQYMTVLNNVETLEQYAINAADGVLLAYLAKLPINIDTHLWERQRVPYNPNGNGVALPVNVISTPMLKEALERAIRDEDYKLASNLSDELKRRKDTTVDSDKQ
uniref:BFN domain-containing protein n=2 Tax=unclassified Prevotella TaxID=2638335 RepID=A0AB33JJE3_9BACT